jgi:hypothetical protein
LIEILEPAHAEWGVFIFPKAGRAGAGGSDFTVCACVRAWVWICRWSLWVWQHLQHRLRSGHCGAQFGSLQQWSQLWSLLSAHLRGFPLVPRRKSWRDYSYRYYLVSVVYTSMEQ